MIGEEPYNVTIGIEPSITLTVLVTVPVFHELSTFVYSNTYVHAIPVFTVQLVGTEMIPLPSCASVRDAQYSRYSSPNHISMMLAPLSVSVGAVVSTTFTVLVALPVLLAWSVYVYTRVYAHNAQVFTLQVITVFVPLPSTLSVR